MIFCFSITLKCVRTTTVRSIDFLCFCYHVVSTDHSRVLMHSIRININHTIRLKIAIFLVIYLCAELRARNNTSVCRVRIPVKFCFITFTFTFVQIPLIKSIDLYNLHQLCFKSKGRL